MSSFTISRETAEIINAAFLPSNPRKMRTAAPETVKAAEEFKRALAIPSPSKGAIDPIREAAAFLLWYKDRGKNTDDCVDAWDTLRKAIRSPTEITQEKIEAALSNPPQSPVGAVKPLEKAAEALKPLADAVFNDNGDMTISPPLINAEQCIRAYFAVKGIRSALEASAPVKGLEPVAVTEAMVKEAKAAYWHDVHHGGGYSDKCYEAALRAALASEAAK